MRDMHCERLLNRCFGNDADAWECLMDWIGNNWIWVLLVVGMVAMHLFGHRGHGQMSRRNEGPDRDGNPDAVPWRFGFAGFRFHELWVSRKWAVAGRTIDD